MRLLLTLLVLPSIAFSLVQAQKANTFAIVGETGVSAQQLFYPVRPFLLGTPAGEGS
jgi:hypothetical protein